jgi:LacI family transcriptional regulator
MPNVTLKTIADLLKISTSTVSKALKDYKDVNPKTKQKVIELARSLNYIPNAFAQSLRNKETKIIGVIVPDLVHHFFSSILNRVIIEAKKKGYLVIVLQSSESFKQETSQLKLLTDKNIDGILLSLSDETVKYNHINDIINNGMPVVLFDKVSRLIKCPRVIINDQKAAFNATEHLINIGCKTIAYITGPLKPQTTIDRFKGYKKALENNNISFNNNLVYERDPFSFDDSYQLTEKILAEHPTLDGVFGFVDIVAIGVLKALKDKNIEVPNQVSVIGFSNWLMTRITSPSLTTIDQSGDTIGKEAFKLLYKNLQNKKNGTPLCNKVIEVPTKLIQRESTKKN